MHATTSTATPLLSDIAAKILQEADGFCGLKLCPLFHTSLLAGQYYVLDDASMLDIPRNIERAPGAHFSRSQTKLSDDQFKCRLFGHEEPITEVENRTYGKKGAAQEAAIRRGQNIILANHELRVKDLVTGAGVPTAAAGVKWSDAASDPIGNARAARQSIFDNCGLDANVMTVGRSVYEVLKEHPQVKDQVKLSSEDSRWPKVLAALFDVEEFIVGKAMINNAQEGQVISVAEIWGDSVILARVDLEEDLKAPSFGRTFIQMNEENPSGVETEIYREEGIASDVVRAQQRTAEKLCAPKAGFHISDVL